MLATTLYVITLSRWRTVTTLYVALLLLPNCIFLTALYLFIFSLSVAAQ